MGEISDAGFPRFELRSITTGSGELLARVGGSGPPVLLLHGYPQTHLMWRAVARQLASSYTVVAADLPGYGGSYLPAPAADHRPHSKRAMAAALVEAMQALGHEVFAVVGHDRGGRVAYRMALDHPQRVERLAVLDIVPTGEVWALADDRFAIGYWHWGFLAQPAPLPEALINAAPASLFELGVRRGLKLGDESNGFAPDAVAAYRGLFDDPRQVQAMCEDYRAGATVDRADDDADRAASRRIACPTLLLWGERGALPIFYGDVLDVWRSWCDELVGEGIDAGHFLAEERADDVASRLLEFLSPLQER